jgi:hypothetical protein
VKTLRDRLDGLVGSFFLQIGFRDGNNHDDRGSGTTGLESHLSPKVANALSHSTDSDSGTFRLNPRELLSRDAFPSIHDFQGEPSVIASDTDGGGFVFRVAMDVGQGLLHNAEQTQFETSIQTTQTARANREASGTLLRGKALRLLPWKRGYVSRPAVLWPGVTVRMAG